MKAYRGYTILEGFAGWEVWYRDELITATPGATLQSCMNEIDEWLWAR